MIGQLINNFEELPTNTLADFNTLFRNELEGEKTDNVVIGNPLTGDMREVLVGKTIYKVLLQGHERKEDALVEIKAYQVFKQEELVITFNGYKDASEFIGVSDSTGFRMCSNGKTYNGYNIVTVSKKIKASEKNEIKYGNKKIASY